MAWLRAYVDKKITDKGGGEHSRILDFEVPDDSFSFALNEEGKVQAGGPVELDSDKHLPKLAKDEQIGQLVQIDPAHAHIV